MSNKSNVRVMNKYITILLMNTVKWAERLMEATHSFQIFHLIILRFNFCFLGKNMQKITFLKILTKLMWARPQALDHTTLQHRKPWTTPHRRWEYSLRYKFLVKTEILFFFFLTHFLLPAIRSFLHSGQ